ncbi:Tubby protein homolog 1 [Seminavis robusta]|uniref:Tubby protein homolog 1 n=1 Tax=Seminavis robusta TaxID=568900 RepID=A0A9N8HJ10_9STRA|nr:Tubby protein homolog 1 [Seminavis robusta]|eukprot:Sro529_g160930.1 Tubby protein homolog 1 (282) ;mRNA; f:9731-10576
MMHMPATEIPTDPNCFNDITGLVHCFARRESGNRNKKIVFYLEGEEKTPPRPILIAQKQKDGKFYIFAVSTEEDPHLNRTMKKEKCHYIGKIRRTRIKKSKLVVSSLFVGTKEHKEQVAATVYDSSTLRSQVVNGFPDRLVYSIVKTPEQSSSMENPQVAGQQEQAASTSSQYPPMASCPRIDDVIRYHSGGISEIGELYDGLQVFRNRHRAESKHQGPFLIRFRGRGARSSQRNIQIVHPSTGELVFQMARWNEDEFTVDFKGPYTPCQAFAIALAQLES